MTGLWRGTRADHTAAAGSDACDVLTEFGIVLAATASALVVVPIVLLLTKHPDVLPESIRRRLRPRPLKSITT